MASTPKDSLAEEMVKGIDSAINAAAFDEAESLGEALLVYAKANNLPQYRASAWSALGKVAFYTNRPGEAFARYDSALQIRKAFFTEIHEEVALSLANIGVLLNGLMGDHEAAIVRFEAAARICDALPDGCSEIFRSNLYNNLGNTFSDYGNYELAEQYYLKSYAIRSKYPDDPRYRFAALLNNLGSMKVETGHLAAADDYLLRSEALYYQMNSGAPVLDHISVWLNRGSIASYEYRFDDAKTHFRKALQLGNLLAGNVYLEYGALHYNLGAALVLEDSLDAASHHYRTAIEFWETYFGFHPNQTTAVIGLGLILEKRGDKEGALAHFKQAEELDNANFPEKHIRRANTYKTIGNFYHRTGNSSQARAYYLRQLKAMGMDEPRASALKNAQASYLLLAGLTDLGKLHFDEFRLNHDTAQLDAALRVFALGDSVLQRLREIRLSFAEQKELLRDARRHTEWAMQAEIARYGLGAESTFVRSEQTRALNLYAKFREDAAVRYAGVPDSLTSKYRSFQFELALAENQLAALSPEDEAYFPAQARLAEIRQSLAALKSRLAQFEQYYKFRFGVPTATLRDVQENVLRQGELMLQYFVGDSTIFVFTIGKNRYDVRLIPLDFPLEGQVEVLRKGISAYEASKNADQETWERALTDYETNALDLYQRLVQPLQLAPEDSILIIVPDGILWLLPFDALLTQQPVERGAFNMYPYLLNRHQTSFAYSATLLRESKYIKRSPTASKTLLACAPFDQRGTSGTGGGQRNFGHLPSSGWEVREAQRLLGGDILLGQNAIKSVFLKKMPAYRTLLFSTHGEAGKRGYVAFYPENDSLKQQNLLFVDEVYNLQINAELVIFSACESAIGKAEPGEGLISMARAFTYAGAKGIVTTLWSVNDYSNSRITIGMLTYLKQGKPATEALYQAKKDWVNNPSTEAAHPWYWAGVLGLGLLY